MKTDRFFVYNGQLHRTVYLMIALLILDAGLVVFFFTKFIIIQFDPWGIILILWFVAMPTLLVIVGRKQQVFSRFFLKYRLNTQGIYCYGICWQSWFIQWDEVCSYCVEKEYPVKNKRILVFSKKICENFTENIIISQDKIFMEIDNSVFANMCPYLPIDILQNVERCLKQNQNGYFQRRKHITQGTVCVNPNEK